MMAIVKSEHELALARELLDDIELSRLNTETIIFKASRLARLCGSVEFQTWLSYEMGGYNSDSALSLKYMSLTGRWTDREKKEGYWAPISQLESSIEAAKLLLQSHSTPNVSGNSNSNIVLSKYYTTVQSISYKISKRSGIRTRVMSILHRFISDIYYDKELENLAESIFETYKKEVDSLISNHARDVLQQIPSVVNRLAENEEESVSQALTTVRRIIDSFADSIYPPSNGKYKIGDNELSLDSSKHQNRLNVFVHERVESKSRKDKIRQNLSNLYTRVSSGVHSDVTVEEAKSLFLNCYLLLGEILHIGQLEKLEING
ncbi:hypothetical protein L378_00688 [Klebsiella pneumoniae MGH 32]|uniref:AbiTii domain-containing protein n=1 Tax=Klebsiella pneumoniae TaxID=573 RepID=UPI0003BEF8F3|nr:hypothetical protein [Klebsiella pneumoniae]ESN06885.1 hypothetical protein L378_00688 [Klebsiella pneumoniae MGH 32]MBC4980773.1 hypothetical protein [Klebsiella pneumoniae]HCI5634467.1 hypothetical protein [Klebsiella pneumoniae]